MIQLVLWTPYVLAILPNLYSTMLSLLELNFVLGLLLASHV
jgi:hypothetical protein